MSIAPESTPKQIFYFGGFELDVRRRELKYGSDLVQLTGKGFDTLVYFLNHRDRLVPREELLAEVWGHRSISENVVDQALTDIRKALRQGHATVWIKTVYGEGYAFVGQVQEIESPSAVPPSRGNSSPLSLPEPTSDPQSSRKKPGLINNRFRWQAVALVTAVFISAILLANFFITIQRKRLELGPSPVQLTASSRSKLSPIVTDGNRVFFTEVEGGRYHLMRTTVDGVEATEVLTPLRNPYVCDISPDSQELLVRDVVGAFDEYGPLWIMPASGPATPRRIPEVTAFDAAWSRRGDQIAVARGFELLFISKATLKVIRKIPLPGYGWWPRWSPKGEKLRLTIQDAKSLGNSIWEVEFVSGRMSKLSLSDPRLANFSAGTWTPDGRHFVFQVQYDGLYSIWAFLEAGLGKVGPAVPLTAGPMGWRGPTISPKDGHLYVRGQLTKFELVQYDARTGQYRRLMDGLSVETVAYSKDLDWIAYTAAPGMTLWKTKANGGERLRLLPPPWQAALPRWSPDGTKIATMLRKPGDPWKIYLVSATDGGFEELVPGGSKEGTPDWSPDGKRIVFGRLFSVEDPAKVLINIVDVASRQVTVIPGSERLFHPAWSPDGQHIVALHSESFHLFLYDIRTRGWQELTSKRAAFPNWTSDGQAVSFLDPDSSFPVVYRVNIKTARVEKLAELRDVRPPNSSFGRWIGFHPSGSILAVHDLSTDQLFRFQYELH